MSSDGLKVLYIAGAHRSGTTLLSDVLGSYTGITGAGELHELWAGLLSGRPCGCGRRLSDCPVWKAVVEYQRQHGSSPRWTPAEAVHWRNTTARAWHTPRIVAQANLGGIDRLDKSNYIRLMADTYRAIATTQQSQVVVDSTKVAAGAAILEGMPGIQPFILHLVRDPRATCHSWASRKAATMARPTDDLAPLRTTSAGVRWLGYNGLAELLRYLPTARYKLLTYEEFIASPRKTLQLIGDWLDVPLMPDPFQGENVVALKIGHSVAGNPSRFESGPKQLWVDDRWKVEMSTRDKLYVSLLAAPLQWKYGYSLLGNRPPSPRHGHGSSRGPTQGRGGHLRHSERAH
jgi:hypothetical protein